MKIIKKIIVHYFCPLFVVFLFTSCGKEKEVEITSLDRRGKTTEYTAQEDNYAMYFSNKLYTGKSIEYYDDAQKNPRKIDHWKRGILNGTSETYYENGQKKLQLTYKNWIIDGEYKEYYNDGKIKTEVLYKDGKETGMKKVYYENGNLKAEINYKEGNFDGTAKTYYENGKLKDEITYKKVNDPSTGITDTGVSDMKLEYMNFDGPQEIKNGPAKAYRPDETTIYQGNYIDNKRDGEWIFYYDNGETEHVEMWNKGLQEGIWKYYSKEKTLLSESSWHSGVLNGGQKVYYDNGKLWFECAYKDGIKIGNYTEYYQNGNKKIEENLIDDRNSGRSILNGERIIYFDNGEIMAQTSFVNGMKNGIEKTYYTNGNVESITVYKDNMRNGERTYYLFNGKTYEISQWKDDKLDGQRIIYVNGDLLKKRTENWANYKLIGSVN